MAYQASIKAQFTKIEDAYTAIIRADSEDQYVAYDKELDKESKRVDEDASKIRKALASADSVPSMASSAGSVSNWEWKVKPNKALEPHKLTRENNTVEFKSWYKKFRAWYTSSCMDTASIQEQQACFRMVIDVNLESKLSTEMQEDTPIFGTDSQVSCMRLLENEFMLQYPLLTRQMDFFELKQTKCQAFGD